MAKAKIEVGSEITYNHGADDNRFHEGVDSHPAVVTEMVDGKVTVISILNSDGRPTIPIRGVKHQSEADEGEPYWS